MAGGIVSRTAHFALHRAVLAGSEAWVGALVPKRWARRAVTRNAIKRQIYAVSAQHLTDMLSPAPDPANPAYVVRLRTAFARTSFVSASSLALKRAVRLELEQLLAGIAAQQDRP